MLNAVANVLKNLFAPVSPELKAADTSLFHSAKVLWLNPKLLVSPFKPLSNVLNI